MKIQKITNRYCKVCKRHTEHKISQVKSGAKRGSLKWGSIQRHKKRGMGTGYGNKGRWGSKPAKPKRTGAKISKKISLKYTCTVCKKSSLQSKGIRTKKLEFK